MQDNKDLTLLKEAAFACGTIAKSFFRKDPKVWEKANDAGPVTEADISINRMLKSELLFNRPDFGWLSEETEDYPDRLSKENIFIIDLLRIPTKVWILKQITNVLGYLQDMNCLLTRCLLLLNLDIMFIIHLILKEEHMVLSREEVYKCRVMKCTTLLHHIV